MLTAGRDFEHLSLQKRLAMHQVGRFFVRPRHSVLLVLGVVVDISGYITQLILIPRSPSPYVAVRRDRHEEARARFDLDDFHAGEGLLWD